MRTTSRTPHLGVPLDGALAQQFAGLSVLDGRCPGPVQPLVRSPHPWITWATVLGPLTLSVIDRSVSAGIAPVVGFYVSLIGAKAVVALLVSGGRHRLTDTGYARTMWVASVLLVVAGLALIVEFAPRAVLG